MTSHQGARRVGPYTIIHSRPVYENPWIKVREDRTQDPSGREATFGVITIKPGVTLLPLDDAGDVYLVREFKYALGEPTLEAISGAIESGETPEQAGLRELGEEANLVASEWVDMGLVNPFTTIVSSPNHIFLARNLSHLRRSTSAPGHLEIVKLPFGDALQSVLDGAITHAATCVLILKTHLFLQRPSRR